MEEKREGENKKKRKRKRRRREAKQKVWISMIFGMELYGILKFV